MMHELLKHLETGSIVLIIFFHPMHPDNVSYPELMPSLRRLPPGVLPLCGAVAGLRAAGAAQPTHGGRDRGVDGQIAISGVS